MQMGHNDKNRKLEESQCNCLNGEKEGKQIESSDGSGKIQSKCNCGND